MDTYHFQLLESILNLFDYFDVNFGTPDLVLYNCGSRVRGKVHEIDRVQAEVSFKVNINGAFIVAQEASKRMIPAKRGAIFFTGATASIKGFPGSATFAMGKFAIKYWRRASTENLVHWVFT